MLTLTLLLCACEAAYLPPVLQLLGCAVRSWPLHTLIPLCKALFPQVSGVIPTVGAK